MFWSILHYVTFVICYYIIIIYYNIGTIWYEGYTLNCAIIFCNYVYNTGQGIQNIQQQMLGSIGGQPMVQYQQQTQQVYQQSLGLQQVNKLNCF